MDADKSTTYWIGELQAGDSSVAEGEIWRRYFDRLVRLARKRLAGAPRRVEDEEDVALLALASFFEGVRAGRFPDLGDRHNLWLILSTIVRRKAISQAQRQLAEKRGGGLVRGESVFTSPKADEGQTGLAAEAGSEPSPQHLAEMCENCKMLLDKLPDDTLRTVALSKLQGFTNAEIAAEVGLVERTVERKLHLIRKAWSENQIP